jgi:tRNA pseudouridine65 synthase
MWFDRKVHLVHRLDRAASGCLVIAFDAETTAALQAALTAPEATKQYLAFTRGYFRWDDPVHVHKPMRDSQGRMKEAQSVVRVVGRSFDPWCSLLLVEPTTGRFHQVRRHVRDLTHPILRDAKHGDSKANVLWRDQWGLPRLGLHCHSLAFTLDGERIEVTCPPPGDLVRIWQQLPWWEEAQRVLPALAQTPLDLTVPETLSVSPDPEVASASAPLEPPA